MMTAIPENMVKTMAEVTVLSSLSAGTLAVLVLILVSCPHNLPSSPLLPKPIFAPTYYHPVVSY